jgi:hypothetical protein
LGQAAAHIMPNLKVGLTLGCAKGCVTRQRKVVRLVIDVVLFFCMLACVTDIVIAAATCSSNMERPDRGLEYTASQTLDGSRRSFPGGGQ